MTQFDFFSVPRILFGRDQAARLGELAAQFGSAALIVHNSSDPAFPERLAQLLGSKVRPVFFRQQGEPKVTDVDQALEQGRTAGCDVVIGFGGGSAIDCAKAVAGLLTNGGSALDYMEVVGKGQKITKPAMPWIAVPTTAGTGAEATRNAVIGAPEKHFKASIRSEHLLPRIALVDPRLGVDVRPEVTARSGMDALCQLIESYTSTGAQPMTDALATKGIELAARSLRRAYQNGHDVDAREDMALAALLSGITLANAGLGAVHGFAAPLGANLPIPHGTVCAVLLPLVIEANAQALHDQQSPRHPVLAKYAHIGRLLTAQPHLSDDQAIAAAIRSTADLVRDLRIEPLRTFGLTDQQIPGLVALARKSSSMRYNPVVLSDETLAGILARA